MRDSIDAVQDGRSSTAGSLGGGRAPDSDVRVRVAVRARPLIARELAGNARSCVEADVPNGKITVGGQRAFTFDHVFSPQTTQEEVYNECVAGLVDGCFLGYNATVLAYGQTSSGKTHTMGSTNAYCSPEGAGIIPRVIQHLFDEIQARSDLQQAAYTVRAQFMEIYREELRDLLQPGPAPDSTPHLRVCEGTDGSMSVAGAHTEIARDASHLQHLLQRGLANRATGSTSMNSTSSRSHAVLTITLESRLWGGAGEVRAAKFQLVDLAGSERQRRAETSEARFREGVTINQGLLALGNVISALGDEKRRGAHVPYRESKLTRMLQDSLGGNSSTCMVCCVSTSDDSIEETINALKYANRARNIRNRPVVNRLAGPDVALAAEVLTLQHQLILRILELQHPGKLPASLMLDASSPAVSPSTLQELKAFADSCDRHAASCASHRISPSGSQEGGTESRLDRSCERCLELETELQRCQSLLTDAQKGLEDAKDDLARDEVIFGNKLEEVKQLRQELSEARSHHVAAASSSTATFTEQHPPQAARSSSCVNPLATTERAPEDGQSNGRSPGWAALSAEVEARLDVNGGVLYDEDLVSYISLTDYTDLRSAGTAEELDALAMENMSALMQEKLRIERQKEELQEAFEAQEAHFRSQQDSLNREVSTLELHMEEKTAVIERLQRNEAEAKQLSEQYYSRMKELESRVLAKEAAMEELRSELAAIEASCEQSQEEREALHAKYSAKLHAIQSQMGGLREQMRQEEAQKVERQRVKSRLKLDGLQAELGRMQSLHELLRRRMLQTKAAHHKAHETMRADLSTNKRLAEKANKRIAHLEREADSLREAVTRKSEQLEDAQRQIKTMIARRKTSTGGGVRSSATHPDTPRGGTKSTWSIAQEVAKRQKWLDSNIQAVAIGKKAEARVTILKRRQSQLAEEASRLMQDKGQLELVRLRGGKDLTGRIETLTAEVLALTGDIRQHRESSDGTSDSSQQLRMADLKSALVAAQHQKSKLESDLAKRNVLSREQEGLLRDINDGLDDLDLQSRYVAEELVAAQSEAAASRRVQDQMQQQLASINPDVARSLLTQMMQALMNETAVRARTAAQIDELRAELAEKGDEMHSQVTAMKRQEVELERRLVDAQAEHATQVQDLLRSPAPLSRRVSARPPHSPRAPGLTWQSRASEGRETGCESSSSSSSASATPEAQEVACAAEEATFLQEGSPLPLLNRVDSPQQYWGGRTETRARSKAQQSGKLSSGSDSVASLASTGNSRSLTAYKSMMRKALQRPGGARMSQSP